MRRPVRIPKKVDLNRIEDYADKVMDPVDVEFTNHFFDRLTRSEHKKDITNAELIGFFKRLSKKKKQFDEFMQRYDEFVAKDKRTDINIPFKSNVDQIIAKTIMRKKDFKTSNAEYKFENYKYNMKHIKIYEQWVSESVNESKKTAKLLKNLKDPNFIPQLDDADRDILIAALKSANELNENEDAYLLHRLAGNIGQDAAAEFLKDNDLDLNLLSKAIQQKTINKYQLRDIVRGDTDKALIKRFIKEQFLIESVESKFIKDKEPSLRRYLKKSPIVVEFGGTDEFDGGAQFFINYDSAPGNLQKLEKFLNTWIKKEKTADVMLDGYQSIDDFSDKDSGWWTYAIDVYPNE